MDINSEKSKKRGLSAIFENVFRQFQVLGFALFIIPIAIIFVFCIAFALMPGALFYYWFSPYFLETNLFLKAFGVGLVGAVGFLGFILGLLIIVPIMNLPCLPFVKSHRGPWFSTESIPWFYHNSLTYLVRYTILDFITPSPLNVLFFKCMGMKVGKGVMINSSNISDPCLIKIDDYATIGGSAYLMAHYGMKGFLIIDKLHIKKGAIIGLSAKILGGVTIGEKAVVAPNVAVLPKTIVKDGEKVGVPQNETPTASAPIGS